MFKGPKFVAGEPEAAADDLSIDEDGMVTNTSTGRTCQALQYLGNPVSFPAGRYKYKLDHGGTTVRIVDPSPEVVAAVGATPTSKPDDSGVGGAGRPRVRRKSVNTWTDPEQDTADLWSFDNP